MGSFERRSRASRDHSEPAGSEVALPGGAGLRVEAEALEDESAIEERLGELPIEPQRVIGIGEGHGEL